MIGWPTRLGLVLALVPCAGGSLLAQASPPSVEIAPSALPSPIGDWLLVGGGYDPLSNQVSLAQDLELARSLLAGRGTVLFAGGRFAPVSVLEGEPVGHDLRAVLARLFAPESAGIRYHDAPLDGAQPATASLVLAALERALGEAAGPLLVYVASHGDVGEEPAQNSLSLWGGWPLLVSDVVAVLERPEVRRSARFVVTSCYGGGFAEIVAGGARPGLRRPSALVHCGLFAAPWDDEASGCDPDPDRRAQEAYGLHFLNALAGRDRDGRPLATSALDLDGDGSVGLLDAHTRARLASRSIDVPTTTSERLLRLVAPAGPRPQVVPPAALLPEELEVVEHLRRELEVADASAARSRLERLEGELDRRQADLDELAAELDDTWGRLRIALLERWPELDEPWSRRFDERLASDGPAIERMATDSPAARRYEALSAESEGRWQQFDEIRIERARLLRLLRSWETLELAARLAVQGGTPWKTFRDLRSCERWAPPLARQRLER